MAASRDPKGARSITAGRRGSGRLQGGLHDAGDWVRDEINARKAEIVFLTKVVAALKTLETMVK